jgi:F-type H+-transporting ATPase subunit a
MFNSIVNPLDQFEIRDFVEINLHILEELKISLTNISLYLILGSFIVLLINMINMDLIKIISDK